MESYFNGIWKDNYKFLEYSGYRLVNYVNDQKPSSVLDIGCGYNRFKGKIKYLTGIDPYNDCADVKESVEEFYAPPYDIVLCLGSINFGIESEIDYQLYCINKLFKKEAIFRVNPGIPHDWANTGNITWYKWTKEKIYDVAKRYKYKVKELKEETVLQGHLRYFFIYTK